MSCSDDAIKSFRGITQQSPPCSRQECSVWPSPPPRRFAGRAWGPIAPHRRIFLGRSRVQANLKDIPRIPCQLCERPWNTGSKYLLLTGHFLSETE